MNQTRLDEIKAFMECHGYVNNIHSAELLAEVERLQKENSGLRANSMIQEHIISSGSDPIRDDKIVKLILENAALKQAYDTNAEVHQKLTEDYVALKSERDTLQKALELACEVALRAVNIHPSWFTADHFIQQAKEALQK